MASADVQPLVLDVGSFYTKAGYAGDDIPQSSFPSVVSESAVGEQAIPEGDETAWSPIYNGSVSDWDRLTRLLRHVFYDELHETPETHPILLSESIFTPGNDRDKLVMTLFELFSVPAVEIVPDAVLAVYGAQRVSGLVVDVGGSPDAGTVRIVPVIDGKCLTRHAVAEVEFQRVAETIHQIIGDVDSRNDHQLQSHIILSGGAPTPNLAETIRQGLLDMGFDTVSIVDQPADRSSVVWKGGALVAANADPASDWISSDRYSERSVAAIPANKYYA